MWSKRHVVGFSSLLCLAGSLALSPAIASGSSSGGGGVPDGTWVPLGRTQVSIPAGAYSPGADTAAMQDLYGLINGYTPTSKDPSIRFGAMRFDAKSGHTVIPAKKKIKLIPAITADLTGTMTSRPWIGCGSKSEDGFELRFSNDDPGIMRDIYVHVCVLEKKDGSAAVSMETAMVAGPKYETWAAEIANSIFSPMAALLVNHIRNHSRETAELVKLLPSSLLPQLLGADPCANEIAI